MSSPSPPPSPPLSSSYLPSIVDSFLQSTPWFIKMPAKEHDVDVDDRPRDKDKARRSKSERKPDRDRDRDREKDRDHDKDRPHRSSKSVRSKHSADGSETHSTTSSRKHRHKKERDHKDRDREKSDRIRSTSTSDLFSGMSNTSFNMTRISLPYPSFSKDHSKEAVKREDDASTHITANPFLTPQHTEVDLESQFRQSQSEIPRPSTSRKSRPPTPPDTDLSADKMGVEGQSKDEDNQRPQSRASVVSRSTSLREDRPEILRSKSHRDDRSRVSHKSRTSSQATYVKPSHKSHDKLLRSDSRTSTYSRPSVRRSYSSRSSRHPELQDRTSTPSSYHDSSSPITPTQSARFTPQVYGGANPEPSATPDIYEDGTDLASKTATPASVAGYPPPPPPPPPPAVDIHDLPRVDYLLQNGGLAYPAPKNFLSVLPRMNGTRPTNPPLAGADTLFAPFFNLLDQYNSVITKQGSIAVATGHRSIARRLLDRLENVFSRDLPPHGCSCLMCEKQGHEIHRGLTWGDVLEWVSGRIELPQWPPFDLAEIGSKAAEIWAEKPARPRSPVQMDPDIDEQFREHYLRQSKKVRSSVDKWLNNTAETPVPPPQEVDDETLTFAILTNLDTDDRPYFNAFMTGSKELKPSTRAPTPAPNRPRNEFLFKGALALQRLYRLQHVPRDAEVSTYLIKNPHTHDLLVTLSNINNSEWEILTSGRFDGFLWSGADADGSPGFESRGPTPVGRSSMSPPSRGPSAMSFRNDSPYSRGPTPASFVSLASSGMPGGRHPVSNDEEMEMAAIAEIEREIYTGMEVLEDAFEKLHTHAELVRTALRQRGAGLMQNLQMRRRIDVLPPGSGDSQRSGYERPAWAQGSELDGGSDDEWNFDDGDIMPDDSASNISSSRHRRPKRRTERRTPAPIEEGDEE